MAKTQQQNTTMGPLLVSSKEAMSMLGIRDPRAFRRLIQQGRIKAVRFGRWYRINVASIYAYANGSTPEA